jgi:hypothetical protein
MLLQLLQILIKVFYPQLEQTFILISFFVEKSTADAITILACPRLTCAFYHLNTVALVFIPVYED